MNRNMNGNMNTNVDETRDRNYAVSWSGGKDSCLALYRLMQESKQVTCLVSMVSETDGRNHAHGVPLDILRLQAKALGLPLVLVDSAGEYEQSLVQGLNQIRDTYGVDTIAFGTLYTEEDRRWNQQVAERAHLEAVFPVWIASNQAADLLKEWIVLGFQAVVCRASEDILDETWVGRQLDGEFLNDIQKTDSCPMGEFGEFHTFVLDGPIFHSRLQISHAEVVLNSGLWSLDIKQCAIE